MVSFSLSLFLSLCILPLALCQSLVPNTNLCGDTCRFRLCRRNVDRSLAPIGRRIIINAAPIPVICATDPVLGTLSGVNTGRPFIRVGGKFNNLRREFIKRGLGDVGKKSFTDVSLHSLYRRFSREKGISSTFNAAQYNALQDECIVLPVVSFRSLFFNPFRSTPQIRVNDPFVDCVSFRTRAPKIHVEWVWAWAGDDFDISVTDPLGETVSITNPQTTNGRLVNDIGGDGCDRIRFARESVVYDTVATPGTYTINVANSGRCPRQPGKNPFALYVLRAFVDGQTVFRKFDRAIGRTFSETFTFKI